MQQRQRVCVYARGVVWRDVSCCVVTAVDYGGCEYARTYSCTLPHLRARCSTTQIRLKYNINGNDCEDFSVCLFLPCLTGCVRDRHTGDG